MFSLLRCVYLFGVQNYDVTLRPLYKVQLVPNSVFPPLIIPYFGSYTLHTHTYMDLVKMSHHQLCMIIRVAPGLHRDLQLTFDSL